MNEIKRYLAEKERRGEIAKSTKKSRLNHLITGIKKKVYGYQEAENRILTSYLKQNKFSSLTKSNKASMLEGFFKYLKSEGYFLVDPAQDLAAKRKDYLPRFTPSQDEVKEILDDLILSKSFPKRNRALHFQLLLLPFCSPLGATNWSSYLNG